MRLHIYTEEEKKSAVNPDGLVVADRDTGRDLTAEVLNVTYCSRVGETPIVQIECVFPSIDLKTEDAEIVTTLADGHRYRLTRID